MSRNSVAQFSGRVLTARGGKLSYQRARYGPKASILLGAVLAFITAADRAEVQTLAYTGSGTTGTFQLSFDGQVTTTLAYNATAAQVQAALALLPNVQSTGLVCAGGALGTASITITGAGALANADLPLITVVNNTTDFSTLAVTETTKGRAYGQVVAWDASTIANPTTAFLTPSGTGAGGTWTAGSYSVQGAWRNAQGSTLPGLPSVLALTASQSLRIAAINAANTPDDATFLDIYVNGIHSKAIAVSTPGTGGNVAQTDIAGPAEGTGLSLPTSNTAYIYGDGRQLARGFAPYDVTTDVRGDLIFGLSPAGQVGNMREPSIVIGGVLRLGDIPGLTALALGQLGGRFIAGGGFGDANSLVLIPGYGGDY